VAQQETWGGVVEVVMYCNLIYDIDRRNTSRSVRLMVVRVTREKKKVHGSLLFALFVSCENSVLRCSGGRWGEVS
jgi:hypothetical protein